MMSTLKLLGIMFCRFNFFQFFSIEELHVHSSSRKRCVISSFCILQNEQLSLSLILIFYKWPAVVIATCNTLAILMVTEKLQKRAVIIVAESRIGFLSI